MVGITGTKGKTTVSYYVKAILEAAGIACGLIGTTGSMIGDKWMKNTLTTPDPIELQQTLRAMVDANVQAVCMEVSAHAIAMHRLEGIVFEASCFTNLSQDHLDFWHHGCIFCSQMPVFTEEHTQCCHQLDDDRAGTLIERLNIPTAPLASGKNPTYLPAISR